MRRVIAATAFTLLGAALAPAFADDSAIHYDQISLSVTAEDRIGNDILVATLFAQHEAERQADAASEVNQVMSWALKQSGSFPSIAQQTLGYTVSPVYKNQRISAWRSRQQLQLRSSDQAGLTKLLGVLQERLGVQAIGYEISVPAREAATDRLVDEAIDRFNDRASRVARQMGRNGYRLVRMDIGTSGSRPPVMRAMAMRADRAESVAAPAIDAGEQTVTVTISGVIELESLGN